MDDIEATESTRRFLENYRLNLAKRLEVLTAFVNECSAINEEKSQKIDAELAKKTPTIYHEIATKKPEKFQRFTIDQMQVLIKIRDEYQEKLNKINEELKWIKSLDIYN